MCMPTCRKATVDGMKTKETWRGHNDSESECDIRNPFQSKLEHFAFSQVSLVVGEEESLHVGSD